MVHKNTGCDSYRMDTTVALHKINNLNSGGMRPLHLHFFYIINFIFMQSNAQLGVKGLAQRSNGETALLTMRFEQAS